MERVYPTKRNLKKIVKYRMIGMHVIKPYFSKEKKRKK